MENPIILISVALSAITLGISIYLALKIKAVHFLLEQPVVKKMSPQLKLKPVVIDERVAERNRQQQQNRDSRPQSGAPNGQRRDGDRNRNDRQGGGDRPDRNRGERPERNDRQVGGERPDRPERAEGNRNDGNRNDRNDRNRADGDRNRNDRNDRNRNDRGDRPDRNDRQGGERRPREVFENREPSAPMSQPQPAIEQPVIRSEAPMSAPVMQEAPLSPRRPLPATIEADHDQSPSSAHSSPENEGGSENFVGSDNDVQHGRRTQLKKKPRFELDEAEVKTEG